VRGTVVVNYDRMVDRNIVGAMHKVSHWIAAGFHKFVKELVGTRDSALWVIHKLRLNGVPAPSEVGTRRSGQRTDYERFPTFGAHLKNAFGAANLAFFFDNPVILGPEALAEQAAAALASEDETDSSNRDDDHNHRKQNRESMLIHETSWLPI
jgi:hypothetical protein